MSYKDGYGLREKQNDGTEYPVGGIMQFEPVSKLPETFALTVPDEWVRTQVVDTCASEAFGNLLSVLNGAKIDALYMWLIARLNNGYANTDWGVDLKSIALSAVKVGAPLYEDSQYHSDGDRDVFTAVENWDLKAMQRKAIVNKFGTALEVTTINGADYFDSIKMVLHKLKTPIAIGVRWNWDSGKPEIDTHSDTGFGHAMLVIGYTKDRLIVLNSWGRSVGNAGYFYFSRSVINHDIAIFGAWTGIDETPEKVKLMLENGIYMEDRNWILNIIKALIIAIKGRLKIAQEVPKNTGVPPYPLKVVKMAEAMARKEGWYEKGVIKNRPQRNCSPMNHRFVSQYVAIGEDRAGVKAGQNGYAIFPDEATGWTYCYKVLYTHITGKSPHYNTEAKKLGLANSGELNFYQYCEIFAPNKDNNDSKKYAEDICEWMGNSPYDKLSSLLS